jgi:Fe-S cluster biosynthesis and repair protein YggX
MTKIEQFRKMAESNPNDELGHFALGRAYLDAGMHADAAGSLARAIEINANLSKAYQLLADAQLKAGQRDQALATLRRGVQVANDRGDQLPRNAMVEMFRQLGEPAPELKSQAVKQAVGEGQVLCARCGKSGPRLAEPPFRNDQGRMIQERVCQPCWREWIGMGTKVINELRLPLSDPQAQRIYEQQMLEFLNLRG